MTQSPLFTGDPLGRILPQRVVAKAYIAVIGPMGLLDLSVECMSLYTR